jgi:carbohydrate ABC transporter substrate-binding protein, CUT1 family (TC 3.A.1.1.-)
MAKALERIFKENQPVPDTMKQAADSIRKALR